MIAFFRSKWFFVAALVYLAGLLAVIARIEPRAFEFKEVSSGLITADMVYGPFQMHVDGPEYRAVPTSQYRGGVARWGVYDNEKIGLDLDVQTVADTLNVEVHAASKSSPAIDETGLYVGSDSGWFYKYDFEGRIQWKFNVAAATKGIHATAALDQKRVYIGAYNGRLYALDKDTGRPDWILELGVAIGASAALHDNALYVSVETAHPNGYIVKVNPADGKVLWVSGWLGGHPHSSPALWPEKNLLFVGCNSMRFFALDMNTGLVKWSFNGEGQIKGTPAVVAGHVYFTSWGRKIFSLNAETGEDEWETFIGGEVQSSPTYVPDHDVLIAHAAGGQLTAVKRTTGNIVWTRQTGMRRSILSATVTRDQKGTGWVVWTKCSADDFCALDPATGRTLKAWRVGVLTGVPVPYKGDIYLALDYPDSFVKLGKRRR